MFGQALNTPILAQSLQRLFDQSLARLARALASAQAHHVVSTGHLRLAAPWTDRRAWVPRGSAAVRSCREAHGSVLPRGDVHRVSRLRSFGSRGPVRSLAVRPTGETVRDRWFLGPGLGLFVCSNASIHIYERDRCCFRFTFCSWPWCLFFSPNVVYLCSVIFSTCSLQ